MPRSLDTILGGGGKDVDPVGGSSEEDAAKDILAAVKTNDATALSLALKRHYEACKASEYEPDEDDEED